MSKKKLLKISKILTPILTPEITKALNRSLMFGLLLSAVLIFDFGPVIAILSGLILAYFIFGGFFTLSINELGPERFEKINLFLGFALILAGLCAAFMSGTLSFMAIAAVGLLLAACSLFGLFWKRIDFMNTVDYQDKKN